jgi:glycosyltransferase involved in cell wall biosynthesis
MKVCIIALRSYQLFNRKIADPSGGAEMQLYLLAKELQKSDKLDVNFIVADYGQQDIEVFEKIRLWKSFSFKQNMISQIFCFFRVFSKVKADVYIQRTLTIFSGMIAIYCRIIGKKFVYMVAHDGETDNSLPIFNNRLNRILINLLFRQASLVIVQNNYELDNLNKKYKGIKIKILKKGLEIIPRVQDKEPRFDCIWVGRCEKWKNPRIYIELAERNPNTKFLMICFPSENDPDYYNELIIKGSKFSNLTFIDYVQNDQIYSYLRDSRIFCFTSELEGDWPMVVLEACASGLPVISYKLNYGLLIDEYHGGIFCNGSIDEMTRQIQKLSGNFELLSSMSKNAIKFVSENHDIKERANQFKSIIMPFSKHE